MPWQENTNSNNGFNQNNGGNGQKTNFKIGKVYGEGGYIDIGLWKAEKGSMATFIIYQAIGKDPDTNRDSFEKKAPNEMPRIFLNKDGIAILYAMLKDKDPSTIGTFSVQQNAKDPDKKITISGSANEVTITLNAEKGQRSFRLPAFSVGGVNVHAKFKVFVDLIGKCYEKIIFAKVIDDEPTTAVEDPFA